MIADISVFDSLMRGGGVVNGSQNGPFTTTNHGVVVHNVDVSLADLSNWYKDPTLSYLVDEVKKSGSLKDVDNELQGKRFDDLNRLKYHLQYGLGIVPKMPVKQNGEAPMDNAPEKPTAKPRPKLPTFKVDIKALNKASFEQLSYICKALGTLNATVSDEECRKRCRGTRDLIRALWAQRKSFQY